MARARIRGKQFDLEYCDRNGYSLLMQGLATIVRVAQSNDEKQALAAGEWLVAYGERLMLEKAGAKAQPVAARAGDREQILRELRGLYQQALGAPPLIVEAVQAIQAVEVSPPVTGRT